MNNDQLDHILKSEPVPPRPAGYWSDFPNKVLAGLRRRPSAYPAHPSVPPRFALPGLAILGLAAICLAVGGFLDFRQHHPSPAHSSQLADARKYYEEMEALFPNQLSAIIFDRTGPHLLLADKPNVPQAPPLYLKVCATSGCENIVTFSGQQIPFNGQKCEVLADARGRVILVGDSLVWPNAGAADPVTVAAQPLGQSSSL